MRGVFFYTIGIAFAGGIFFRSFFGMSFPEIALPLIVGMACLVARRLAMNSIHLNLESPLFLLALACMLFSLGAWRMHSEEITPSFFSVYAEKEISLIGKIVREPEIRETNIHLYIAPVGIPESHGERILVTAIRFTEEASQFSYGDIVRAKGILRHPEAFQTDGGRVFDYPGYLKARGVTHVLPFAEVRIETEESGTFLGHIFRGKQRFMDILEKNIPEPYAGLGEGVLLGVKRALGEDLERTFRETGIIHIVVLSGYNIMIVAECIMYMLSFFFFPRTRMIVGIMSIALFALLVGLSATVVRASIMAGLLLIARGTGRIYAVLRALMLAGMVMLIMNPYLLMHDPGFQLSFLATLGLILLSPHIEKRLTALPELLGMKGIVTATIATQFFVLPLLLYHMGLFSVVSIIVNVLVLPMVPIAMLLTFVTGIIGAFSSILGMGAGYFAHLSLGYIIYVAEIFGALPFTSFTIGVFPFWVVVVVYAGFVFALIRLYKTETIKNAVPQDKVAELESEYSAWTIVEEGELAPKVRDSQHV